MERSALLMTRAQRILQKVEEAVPLTPSNLRSQGYRQNRTNPQMWVHPKTGDMRTPTSGMRLR